MYEYTAKVIRVVDGDTLEVDMNLGFGIHFIEKLRLLRVDTPEVHGVKHVSAEYARGKIASAFTQAWVDSVNSEIIVKTKKDRKGGRGRYLAEVYSASNINNNLQEAIIKAGHDRNSPLTYQD